MIDPNLFTSSLDCPTCGRPSCHAYETAGREVPLDADGGLGGCAHEGSEACLEEAVAMWKASAQERRAALDVISGILCDARDVDMMDERKGVAELVSQRDEARALLVAATRFRFGRFEARQSGSGAWLVFDAVGGVNVHGIDDGDFTRDTAIAYARQRDAETRGKTSP